MRDARRPPDGHHIYEGVEKIERHLLLNLRPPTFWRERRIVWRPGNVKARRVKLVEELARVVSLPANDCGHDLDEDGAKFPARPAEVREQRARRAAP